MSSGLARRIPSVQRVFARPLARHASTSSSATSNAGRAAASAPSQPEPLTHFRITLRRSAIALPERYQATLTTLGLHKRLQTVYHPHSQSVAGKILKVKELVEVANVPVSAVRTKAEQRAERRPPRGYSVERPREELLGEFAEGVVSTAEREKTMDFVAALNAARAEKPTPA